MSNRIPVFDDWGRKVGDFIPEGGGCGEGLVVLLAIIILWSIGATLYAIYWLIAKGIEKAKEGKWSEAIAYWAIIEIPIVIQVVSLAIGAVKTAQEELPWKNPNVLTVLASPQGNILLRRTGELPTALVGACLVYPWDIKCENQIFWTYDLKLVNRSLWTYLYTDAYKVAGFECLDERTGDDTAHLYCYKRSPEYHKNTCITVWIAGGITWGSQYSTYRKKLCLDYKTGELGP